MWNKLKSSIDHECDRNTDDCDDISEICVDTTGSFLCECADGFSDDTVTNICEDINECDLVDCGTNTDCNNTIGSYECYCLDGYALIPSKNYYGALAGTCQDIDECVLESW